MIVELVPFMCSICGEETLELAQVKMRKWEVIKTEMDKCELVCANCHAIRTYNRKPRGSERPY